MKIKIFLTLLISLFYSYNFTYADVWWVVRSEWSIIEGGPSDCASGSGWCFAIQSFDNNLEGGELSINNKTYKGFITVDKNTPGIKEYIKGDLFNSPSNNLINPEVLKAETGINGLFYIPEGNYKYIEEKEFYKIFITIKNKKQ